MDGKPLLAIMGLAHVAEPCVSTRFRYSSSRGLCRTVGVRAPRENGGDRGSVMDWIAPGERDGATTRRGLVSSTMSSPPCRKHTRSLPWDALRDLGVD